MATVTTAAVSPRLAYRNNLFDRIVSSMQKSPMFVESMPFWRADAGNTFNGAGFLGVDRSGKIRGTVLLGSTPVVRAMVYLYYRPSGGLIRSTFTGVDGAFVFSGLDKTDSNYFTVAVGAPSNAQVFDKVVPL